VVVLDKNSDRHLPNASTSDAWHPAEETVSRVLKVCVVCRCRNSAARAVIGTSGWP